MEREDQHEARAARDLGLAVVRCEHDGRIVWANDAARRLGAGDDIDGWFDRDHRDAVRALVTGTPGHGHRRAEALLADGMPVELLASAGDDARVTLAVYNLTEFHHQLTQTRIAARTDPLTGLRNRTGFFAEPRLTGAVLIADVDRFKLVNDTHGHHVGDEVLGALGRIMTAVARGDEVVARFGGDEFVVHFPDGGAERAAVYAEELDRALGLAVETSAGPVRVSVTCGVATVEAGDIDTALRQADVAMYRAKAGRGEVDEVTQTIARLKRTADIDTRTGLARDHRFTEDLDRLAQSCSPDGPLSMVLLDLDRFHDFNTRYLYETGHQVLRQVADTLRATVRDDDRCYRYGGEEFAVLLADTPLDAAVVTAERVRAAVEALAIEHLDSEHGVVTVSAGVATLTDPTDPSTLVNGANVALLRAKDSGRNAIRAGTPSDDPAPMRRRD